jgi:hypothetical protein
MMHLCKANRQLAGHFGRRSNSTIAGTVYYRCTYHGPERTAVISPSEKIKWTYAEFWDQIEAVAGGLTKAGYGAGSIIATDLDHNSQSLLLQMACAHNQMQLLTVTNEEEYKRLGPSVGVQGAVSASESSFLKGTTVPQLQKSGGKAGPGATDRACPLAYYGSDIATGNRQVYLHGVGIAGLLKIKPDSQVCVAASLNHAFGLGGVVAAVVRSASIYLPDPSSPDMGDSDFLIADEKSSVALKGKSNSKLKDGIIKVGAYNDATGIPNISGFSEVGGVSVHELDSVGTHPLFDACSDTYYPLR